jgi:tryptophan synthase alpha chain
VARLGRHTQLPVCIGFGIRTPEHAANIARLADGAVVGSAFVDLIEHASSPDQAVDAVLARCRALADGVHHARE